MKELSNQPTPYPFYAYQYPPYPPQQEPRHDADSGKRRERVWPWLAACVGIMVFTVVMSMLAGLLTVDNRLASAQTQTEEPLPHILKEYQEAPSEVPAINIPIPNSPVIITDPTTGEDILAADAMGQIYADALYYLEKSSGPPTRTLKENKALVDVIYSMPATDYQLNMLSGFHYGFDWMMDYSNYGAEDDLARAREELEAGIRFYEMFGWTRTENGAMPEENMRQLLKEMAADAQYYLDSLSGEPLRLLDENMAIATAIRETNVTDTQYTILSDFIYGFYYMMENQRTDDKEDLETAKHYLGEALTAYEAYAE